MHTTIKNYNQDLFTFLRQSPTPFHASATMAQRFQAAGFKQLEEQDFWNLKQGEKYFVLRESGSIAAFCLGTTEKIHDGFRIAAAHSDSPCLQLKPCAAISTAPYLQFGIEIYGGPLLHQWFDRDLSLAGRLYSMPPKGHSPIEYLVDWQRPLLFIPSLAIHLDREANKKKIINTQQHLTPLVAQELDKQLCDLATLLSDQLSKEYPDEQHGEIIRAELFCYDIQPPALFGINQEFISASRLDNLLSCHGITQAACAATNEKNFMAVAFNHEENGSNSSSGAQGSFLKDLLYRIVPNEEQRQITLRNSLLVSMDNAHASHPNYPEKTDPAHPVYLNSGVVIKYNANQRYATNARTAAAFTLMARKAGVAIQEFVMRNDMPCGSTIGPMTAAKLGLATVDVGAPTLGMHSIREVTGSRDPYDLYKILHHFFIRP